MAHSARHTAGAHRTAAVVAVRCGPLQVLLEDQNLPGTCPTLSSLVLMSVTFLPNGGNSWQLKALERGRLEEVQEMEDSSLERKSTEKDGRESEDKGLHSPVGNPRIHRKMVLGAGGMYQPKCPRIYK